MEDSNIKGAKKQKTKAKAKAKADGDSAEVDATGDGQLNVQQVKKVDAAHEMLETLLTKSKDLVAVARQLKAQGLIAEFVITQANDAVMEGEVDFTTVTALKGSKKELLYEANMQDSKAAKGNMRKAHKDLAGHVKRTQGLLNG